MLTSVAIRTQGDKEAAAQQHGTAGAAAAAAAAAAAQQSAGSGMSLWNELQKQCKGKNISIQQMREIYRQMQEGDH